MKTQKIILSEKEMPTQWYNMQADMPNPVLPALNPQTRQPITPEELSALFPLELIKQEVCTERYVDIPEQVLDVYKIFRPTPLVRAVNFEKALGTKSKIYFKNESVSPSGSHKTNTAIAQAYYNAQAGVKKLTTETGAGQWGSALSFACKKFGIQLQVYMVRVSYEQKPYRKSMMQTWGAEVFSSPTALTNAGRSILAASPDSPGSLGIAISEAVEKAATNIDTNYSLGSVLNHVLLHQTIIGEETLRQFAKTDDYPDVVIAPFGGGSNFAGISFSFLRENLHSGKKTCFIAVEPSSCPKLTQGEFRYDFGDSVGLTPLIPMYTLGHDFVPPSIHAGGLRYHGAGAIVSQLLKDGLVEAAAVGQLETFEAGMLFAQTEGIIPAPESNHAIAQVIKEVRKAETAGEERTILFNLSGHGYFDLSAYDKFHAGELTD